MVILLVSFASQNSLASVMISTGPPLPPPSMGILWQHGGFGACLIGEPCITPDAPWVELQLPTLQVGQETSISTTSSRFGFYLGNSLTGQIDVSLTPVFQIQDNENFVDELTANIANRTAIFSKTHNGLTSFEAVSGTDYYLLLSGQVRAGTTYQLQLSQVPLPAAFYLFGSGLLLLLNFGRNRSGLDVAV